MAGRPPGGSADGKQRLLNACWNLLVELPVGQRLTIAAVCDRAECTPPTLYHHFGDLAALERAASRRTYSVWSDEMQAASSSVSDPRERMTEKARAYLGWARQHPDAYHVLFSQPRRSEDPNTMELKSPAFMSLTEDLAEIHDVPIEHPSIMPLALAFWTGLHGAASLAIAVPFYTDAMQDTVLDVLSSALIAYRADEHFTQPTELSHVSLRDAS